MKHRMPPIEINAKPGSTSFFHLRAACVKKCFNIPPFQIIAQGILKNGL